MGYRVHFAIRAGPRWPNNEIFLIGRAYDQGWIYASMPEGRIGHVFPDVFGLDINPEELVERLFSQMDLTTGEYHLMAAGGLMPSILLYPSELVSVEEIPFKGVGSLTMHGSTLGFSPDGQWMMLTDPAGKEPPPEQIGVDYWIRPVDPPVVRPFPCRMPEEARYYHQMPKELRWLPDILSSLQVFLLSNLSAVGVLPGMNCPL